MNDSLRIRTNSTDITVLLDCSESMRSHTNETITGFNRFLTDARSLPGPAVLTLITANDRNTIVWYGPTLESVPDLSPVLYDPQGDLALYDAIGMAIEAIKTRLDSLPIEDVADKLVFAIVTAGMDHGSRRFNRERLFQIVTDLQFLDHWTFLFLGAGPGAVGIAADIGIRADRTMSYSLDSQGIGHAFRALSRSVREARLRGTAP